MSSRFSTIKIGMSAEKALPVTEEHFLAAARLFHDTHPIHSDDQYAREHGHPSRTLPGTVIGGIMSSSLAVILRDCGLALLEYKVRFKRPVYVGDTLTTRWEVVGKEAKPHRGGGLLFLKGTCRNQHAQLVALGDALDLVSDAEAGA